MPITASRVSRFVKLADDLDAALARGDEIGMDLLKSMLPELCEAVEEINEGLREIDTLLFEGLRDEAIGLHDSELPKVALRLHLEDKPQWPMAALFFESEGIRPPPPIDFNALSSLNSAYADLDRLRKPLDRLRRLALEKAPLPRKISLLRKLRKHDSLKPVWAEQVTTHEDVRVLELGDAVKQAFRDRDPHAIATLHEELSSPDWSVPVPARLKQDTRGGDVWAKLRHQITALEGIAAQLERDFATREDSRTDAFDCIDRLRDLRQEWLNGEAQCREWLFSLPQYTAVLGLARSEDFGQRLDSLRGKVATALQWLAAIDQRDFLVNQFTQACNELELLTEKPPSKKDEAKWLARIEKVDGDLLSLCQQLPQLKIPESLPMKVDRAVAEVRRQGRQRSRNRVISVIAGVVLSAAILAVVVYDIRRRQEYEQACDYVKGLLPAAQKSEYVVRPEVLDAYATKYGSQARFGSLLEEFDKLTVLEQSRREEFERLVGEHEEKLGLAARSLAERAEKQETRLDEWPPSVFEALDKYRSARLKGGFPKRRNFEERGSNNKRGEDMELPPAAQQRLDQEETRLAEQKDKQERVERSYSNAAIDEFVRRLREIETGIPSADAPDAAEVAKELLRRINELSAEGRMPRSSSVDSSRRIPFSTLESAKPAMARLETLVKQAGE